MSFNTQSMYECFWCLKIYFESELKQDLHIMFGYMSLKYIKTKLTDVKRGISESTRIENLHASFTRC